MFVDFSYLLLVLSILKQLHHHEARDARQLWERGEPSQRWPIPPLNIESIITSVSTRYIRYLNPLSMFSLVAQPVCVLWMRPRYLTDGNSFFVLKRVDFHESRNKFFLIYLFVNLKFY
jgi:hypothetical protein